MLLCVQFAASKISEYDYYEEEEASSTRRVMAEMTSRRLERKNEAPASRPFQEVKIPGLVSRFSSASSSMSTSTTTPRTTTSTTSVSSTKMTVQDQFYQAAIDIIPEEERKKFGLFTLDDVHAMREAERKMVLDAVKVHMQQLDVTCSGE